MSEQRFDVGPVDSGAHPDNIYGQIILLREVDDSPVPIAIGCGDIPATQGMMT